MGADCSAIDAVVAGVRHNLGQRHRYGLPDPSLAPAPEPAIDRVPTAIFGRDIAPRRSTAKSPEYAVDDRAVLLWAPPSATVFGFYRQQVLQNPPFRFSKIASAQVCIQKAALNQPKRHASTAIAAPIISSYKVAMQLDLCTPSTGFWIALAMVSTLAGAAIAYVSSVVFPKSGFDQSSTSGQTLAGGCLLPIFVGICSGFGVSRLLPHDPCGGAFTPDTVILPPFVSLIMTSSAIALFWFRIWRKSTRGDRLDP